MKIAPALAWGIALLLTPGIIDAHAELIATSPPANATIASSPGEVSVTFSEPVAIESAHALVIMRTDGTPVLCAGAARRNSGPAARVVCRPVSPLARGAYTAFWLVTSDDTHVVHGAFSFGVGVALRQTAGAFDDPYDPAGLLASVIRWISLAGAALIVGTLTFEAFIARADAFPEDAGPALAALSRSRLALGRAGVCIVAFGSLLALDVQAAAATGSDALRAVASLPAVVVESTWGLAWLARMCALTGIGLLTWRAKPSSVSLGLCALFVLSFGQSGHAGSSKATLAADWIHMTCASIWFGGLATLAAGLKRALTAVDGSARLAFATAVIRRFSAIALPAVAALVASGIYASLAHFVSVTSLTGSPYGRVILAKLVLLLPLLALGYYHYRSGRGSSNRAFTVTLACEAALVLVILGLSAILTGLPPPHAPGSEHG